MRRLKRWINSLRARRAIKAITAIRDSESRNREKYLAEGWEYGVESCNKVIAHADAAIRRISEVQP